MTVVQIWDLGDGTTSATSVAVTVVDGIIGRDGAPGTNGTNGTNGTDGAPGADGVGVPVGGTTGQVLAKIDATDFNTDWVDQPGSAVDSVNGQVGVVVLAAADVGADTAADRDAAIGVAISAATSAEVTRADAAYDPAGAAGTAQANAEAYSDAAASAEVTRANAAYDALGAAASAQAAGEAASQPLDSDLTAIAALTTTTFGRALLTEADAAALRTTAGLGTAATSATADFDASGAASAAQAASQPLDSDLTAIAALATTAFGRSFLALADAAAGRTLLGLGTLATQSGTFSGTSSGTNTGDQSIPTALPPNGAASGDLSGTYPSPNVAKINGTALSGLATGLVKNTTTTGVPSIAAAADVPTVAAGGTGPLSATDATTTNSRTPTAHHTTHESGGTDAVSLAASQITSGVLAIGRLASGAPDGTKFVRDDGTLAVPSGSDISRLKWIGDWLAATSYAVNDVVRYANKLWVCTSAVTGSSPSASFVGSAANKISSNASFTVTLPAGSQAGDKAMISLTTFSATQLNPPLYATIVQSGVNNSYRLGVYQYTLGSADITAGTLTIPAQTNYGAAATVHVFRGVAPAGTPTTTLTLSTAVLTPPAGAAFVYDAAASTTANAGGALTQASLSGVVSAADVTLSNALCGAGYEAAAAGVATTSRTFTAAFEAGGGADRQTISVALVAALIPFQVGSFALLGRSVDEAVNTVTASSTTQTIPDTTVGTLNLITLTGNCTFTFPTAAAGKRFRIALTQDATGSRTVTWPGTVKWPAATAPTLTTTAAKTDHFEFTCYDGTNWIGQTLALNY